jgi:winged helix DNA-binding protein
MDPRDIAAWRLASQHIATPTCTTPLQVVRWLTAIQAQDYRGALWSIGLRMPQATAAHIERAIADRSIVRTWPLRRTLHFVAADDVRWMLALLRPRAIAGAAGRLRQLELDAAVIAKGRKALVASLEGGRQRTRAEIYDALTRARIAPTGQRGIHLLWHYAVEGVLCFASHSGNKPAFALLDEWIPSSRSLSRDAALAELACRYFRSHGPATRHDFVWWSGLTVGDAKAAIEMLPSEFTRDEDHIVPPEPPHASPGVHLLPGFDEFLLAYKDRSATLSPAHARKVVPGNNGMFMPTIVAGGRVVGTWKPTPKGVVSTPFRPLTQGETRAYQSAVKRYTRFAANE